jgi:hypothetical protein
MLLLAELAGMEVGEAADDCYGGVLRLGRQQLSISATCGSSFDGIRIRFL